MAAVPTTVRIPNATPGAKKPGDAASTRAVAPESAHRRGMIRALLGVPLVAKLAGATLLIVVGVLGVILTHQQVGGVGTGMLVVVLAVLFGTLAVQLALVSLALRPLAELERIAGRVLAGDLDARAKPSPLADRNVARLGRALNILLDALTEERARLRRLASMTIRSQDAERAQVARELHESMAQQVAGMILVLGVAGKETDPTTQRIRLEEIRTSAVDMLEDLRTLSQTVHPMVLDDLGPAAAVEQLARRLADRTGLQVEVQTNAPLAQVPEVVASTLYRVARQALDNVVRHASATKAWVDFTLRSDRVTLRITDDGQGFAVANAESSGGAGIFSMREWVSLLDGQFDLASAPRLGTRVEVTLPLRFSEESGT